MIVEDIKKVIGKIVRQSFEELYEEIQDYFKMIKKILIADVEAKLNKPETELLKIHNLSNENLKDPIYLPEILALAKDIKENNFNYFDREWNTYGYFHHDHAYMIKDIISELQPYSRVIEEYRLNISVKENQDMKEKFIEGDFEKYNLPEFENLRECINKAAYDDTLYRTLPILLRTIFENLLWYIFKDGLSKKHIILFFNPNKNRIRDFSQLIFLLNNLRDKELIPVCKNAINSKIIDYLIEIQKIGNWNVHEIHNHVGKDFADNWKEKINLIINSLMLVYKSIKGKNIEIEDNDRLKNIHDKLGIK